MTRTHETGAGVPAGTVTFLFTDIEGSTRLWERHPADMGAALARHDALVRGIIEEANGYVFSTGGDGFCAAFALAPDAVAAAVTSQLAIAAEQWPAATQIKVRMALHTGAVETRDGDYFGPSLNRVARVLATGYGDQILASQATYELTRDTLPDGVFFHDLGEHRLKDLARAERVYQLEHPELRKDFPAIRSLSTHPNNLPQLTTTFVGRENEIANLRAMLGRSRLLTLTGTGGSGKTRLSLQVAAEVLEEFPDGAWFVELAAVTTASLVGHSVASVLGVVEQPGKQIIQSIVDHLLHKRLLLVLDNCEHLVKACAGVAATILERCPGVRIVASSREALAIAGEQRYRVPSLSLPNRAIKTSIEALTRYESARLFIDRALLVLPEFQITNENAPALVSLCHHLDGIPLAIELAAARVRSMTLGEIDGKIDQRFRLLTGGSRTALPRQQTLRSLIDWSYDLLQPKERCLLQHLSPFAGGCTLTAAEEVCASSEFGADDVFDHLTSLCDKSLVVSDQSSGRSRYLLLETVRQYARDRLDESGQGPSARGRHRDYFTALAQEANDGLGGSDGARSLQHLEQEYENLRCALDWSLVDPGNEMGLQICGALFGFWTKGRLSEGREWCDRVFRACGDEDGTLERAKALNTAGALAYLQGDYVGARTRWEEGLAIRRRCGDKKGVARLLGNLGAAANEQGDQAAAELLQEESLAVARELEDWSSVASSLNNLGVIAFVRGDYARAQERIEESLVLERKLDNRNGIARLLTNLGSIASEQGDLNRARELHEEALQLMREAGDRVGLANVLYDLGDVALMARDMPRALEWLRESLAIRQEIGDKRGIAFSLKNLGAAAACAGGALRAATMWGASERLREEIQSPIPDNDRAAYDRSVTESRNNCSDTADFDKAWQQGRAITLEQAIAMGLESVDIAK